MQSLAVAAQRELGLRGSLSDFVRIAWPVVEPASEFSPNWHINLICSELEKVYTGETHSLIVNIPPGCGKSLLVQVFWPVWTWIRDPTWSFMSASFDQTLTMRDADKSLRLIQDPWFRERWGDRVQIAGALPKVSDYETLRGGFRFSTSVGGKATGRHPSARVIDDANKPEEVSPEAFQRTVDWHSRTWSSRGKNPKAVREVVIAQRLHENDISGYLLGLGGYKHVCLPMEFDPKNACLGDPRTERGEILWKERYSPELITLLKRRLGRNYIAQYDQAPSPDAGSIFKRVWFKKYKKLPDRGTMILSWDCTFKDEQSSDFVVGQVWLRDGASFYLVDQVRERLDFPDTVAAVRAMAKKYPKAHAKLIEDKANGPAVIATLRKEIPGLLPVNPEGGKIARANAVAPLFEAGNVYFPESADWLLELEDELLKFPKGKHDDQVDSCSQALLYLDQGHNAFAAAMQKLQDEQGF